MRDLDKARDPIQRAEWARENLREAGRDLRAKLKALAKILDDVEREEGRAAHGTDAGLRAIFGEPVKGRDYDVMPSQDAKAKSVGEIEREIAIEAGDDTEDGEL